MKTSAPIQIGQIIDHALLGPTEVISVCTRDELIEAGELVDCTQEPFDGLTREIGIIADIAMTQAVFERYVRVPANPITETNLGERYGRILRAFRETVQRKLEATTLFVFLCHPNGEGRWQNESEGIGSLARVQLKAEVHSGDRGEPCITFLLPSED